MDIVLDKSNWITHPQSELSSFSFCRLYQLKSEIKSAKILIACMGWYHLFVNGKKIDKNAFTPGWTEYYKRVQFQEYHLKNIKDILSLKIDVGEGWAASKDLAMVFKRRNGPLYYPISINYKIIVEYKNNTFEVFTSDESVKVFTNEVTYNSIYNGEIQDQTKKPLFIGQGITTSYPSDIIPNEGEDIAFKKIFKPIRMFDDKKGNRVIDFGQNIAGVIKITYKGKKGEIISYVPGEILDKEGNFYNENYRAAKSFFSFVCSGKKDVFIPKFSFLGGRYIKLINYPLDIRMDNFEAIMVHSDMKQTCFFECKNKKIQRLYLNTFYGQLGNYLDVPTDCPQRDERLGWTADAQVFAKTAAIHFDVDKFFNKWLKDMSICQKDDGAVPAIIPDFGNQCNLVSSAWSDACTVCPWEMYQAYDDVDVLKNNLPMMEKWVSYLMKFQIEENIIDLPFSFGDWLALDTFYDKNNFQGATTHSLISTVYYYYAVDKISKIKKILKQDDSFYSSLLPKIKEAFNKRFLPNGHLNGVKATFESMKYKEKTDYTQTALVLILYFDLCYEKERTALADDLVNLIKLSSNRLTTGFIGTPYILSALADNNHGDVAYSLLLNEGYPSWLYSVDKGATTMWEHWDGIKEDGSLGPSSMNSYNHYAYGSVFAFIFEYCVGIKKTKPGYKEVIIEPHPNKELGAVKTKFKSKYGNIFVAWKYKKNSISYEIKIDKGIEATVIIDGETVVSWKGEIPLNFQMEK